MAKSPTYIPLLYASLITNALQVKQKIARLVKISPFVLLSFLVSYGSSTRLNSSSFFIYLLSQL